ncbi:MAG TPA: hemerythrin domain-containing protein [Rhodospirillales bacterium]|nr:hemerythrin domain-containing protein [Rhodospirillales bacterium]
MEYSTSICNTLHEEHMMTVGMLEKLETALTKIGRKNLPAANDPQLSRLLTDLIAIMQSEISSHFGFEEDHLFPRIEEMGDSAMLTILRDEHNTIRPLAARVSEVVKASRADGFSPDRWAELYDLGLELAEREIFHIQKEEMGFLSLLDQFIEPDEDRALSMAFAEAKAY